ncbi:hypothetical protein CEXT_629051 [Caerostris extrusa]|uniref:Uncharacterized protein n=1 Tax=Caerostris extrusa TaxID=172846 RepID=A0AAV4P3K1_CAEEX|nr:hypothetical protein CEXT_629051 [Caerostris extrusa]
MTKSKRGALMLHQQCHFMGIEARSSFQTKTNPIQPNTGGGKLPHLLYYMIWLRQIQEYERIFQLESSMESSIRNLRKIGAGELDSNLRKNGVEELDSKPEEEWSWRALFEI